MGGQIGEDARIEHVAQRIARRGGAVQKGRGPLASCVQAGRRQVGAGPVGERGTAPQHPVLELGGKAAGRLAQAPLKELDHALGKGELTLRVERVLRRQVVGNHEQGHVAHNLGRRRHLDDITEQEVDLAVGLADLMPPRGESQSLGLLEQIGVLAAGHFQVVEVGGRRPRARLERSVHVADVFPVAADLDQGPVVDVAVARVKRSDSTIALKLGCEVRPDIEAMAPSAMSSPTSAPLRMLAAWAPPMSWV